MNSTTVDVEPKRYHHIIYTVSRSEWLRQFTLHVLTGFLTVAAHYSLMWLLVVGGLAAVPASGIGFMAGAATRYLLSYTRIFSPGDGVPITLVRFSTALGLQWLSNILLLEALLKAHLTLWVAQFGATVLLTLFTFLAYRHWVFKP